MRSPCIVLLSTWLLTLGACGTPAAKRPPRVEPPPAPPGWQLDWARGAVLYEVFVRSFADADGDGVGDLAGLTARLDYLNDGDPATDHDLGVDGLWLMPVFESPSYHGYDVVDYERIDREYGGEADFDRLLVEAHRRGLRVIVDLVMNHTSREHPWFVAAGDPTSPSRPWYVWRVDDPGWTQPWGGNNRTWHRHGDAFYYGVFWGGMPDLNFAHPPVREEMKRLASHWLRRGVDGFRLDATRHLFANGPGDGQNDQPETHAFLRELAAHVRAERPDALLVGENWTDTEAIAAYYGDVAAVPGGDELPMSFNFPLAGALVDAVRAGDTTPVREVLAAMVEHYPPGVLDAPFLTNHDMVRVATQLGGDEGKLAQAAALLLTLPGTPFLYYGEEVGLANGPGGDDRQKRSPMPWDATPGGGFTIASEPWVPFVESRDRANVAAQADDPESLLATYRRLIHLRSNLPALRLGDLRLLPLADPGLTSTVLAFTRDVAGVGGGADGSGASCLVVHNLGTTSVALSALAGDPELASRSWSVRFGHGLGQGQGAEGAVRLAEVVVPAGGSVVLTGE